MTSRARQQRVFLGEIGDIVLSTPITNEPLKDVDLDDESLTYRDLCKIALQCGIDIRIIIGVDTCIEHYSMVYLGDREMPDGYNLIEHCKYCRNCFQFFRLKRI